VKRKFGSIAEFGALQFPPSGAYQGLKFSSVESTISTFVDMAAVLPRLVITKFRCCGYCMLRSYPFTIKDLANFQEIRGRGGGSVMKLILTNLTLMYRKKPFQLMRNRTFCNLFSPWNFHSKKPK
jgi:hypothetical protein